MKPDKFPVNRRLRIEFRRIENAQLRKPWPAGCGLRALATRATHSHRTVAERAAFGSALGQLSPCRDAIGQLGKGGPGQQLIVLLTEQMRRHRVQPGVAA